MLWSYRAVFTQTTSTGTVEVRMTAQENMTFLWGQLGTDDYASGRAFRMWIHNEDDDIIGVLEQEAAVDNQIFPFPVSDISASVAGDGPYFNRVVYMGKGDYVSVRGVSLLATETLTVVFIAKIKTTKPVVAATTTAGTIPVVVSQDKVI